MHGADVNRDDGDHRASEGDERASDREHRAPDGDHSASEGDGRTPDGDRRGDAGQEAPTAGSRRAPSGLPLRVAAALVAGEALAVLANSVVEGLSIDADRLTLGVTTTVFFVLYGLALGWCAYGLLRHNRWSRAPVVLSQLIQAGIAWSFLGGSTTVLGVVLGLAAIAVLVLVMLPSSIDALVGR